MKNVRYHEEIKHFLHQVCLQIRAKEVHNGVKAELESHLQDIVDEQMADGVDADTAVREAVKQMGDPALIGNQLHRAHRPRMDWGLIALMLLMTVIGLFAVFATQSSMYTVYAISTKQVGYVSIGAFLMFLGCFSNYRRLVAFSWPLYISANFLLLLTLLFGGPSAGWHRYLYILTFSLDSASIAPYLLVISLAGLWSSAKHTTKLNKGSKSILTSAWNNIGIVILPGILILLTYSLSDFALFFIGCMVLVITLRKSRWLLLTYSGLMLGTILSCILISSYRMQRIAAMVSPEKDPLGFGFMAIQSLKTIRAAGWTGHGFGSSVSNLPEIHAEMMFPYLIYCFGWLAGIAIFMLAILFIARVLHIMLVVKDPFGKALVTGLLSIFAVQFLWSMLMAFGLAPITSISLPFLSYSGNVVIFQLATIGIILSVYRHKDLVIVVT